MVSSGRPILVGPWRSEVGFEVMYQIPFLRWFKTVTGVKGDRLFPITRGGAGVLYQFFQPGVDLYQLRSVDSVRQENFYDRHRTGMQKQTLGVTEWDRDVLKEAARQLLGRGARYHVLHPSVMYRALTPWWDEQRGLSYLRSLTEFQPLPKPAYKDLQLPDQFVAMKWYGRATFEVNQEPLKQFCSQVTGTIAQHIPVILLAQEHGGDEHTDLIVTGQNIATLPKVPPQDSVHIQAAVLARASAFVGTYGGVAQMALRMGIPSCSFFDKWGGTAQAHLTLSQHLSLATGTNFQVGNLSDAQLWTRVVSVPAVPQPVLPPGASSPPPKPELVTA